MHLSQCRPRIGLEALEIRLTPSATPLSATLPLLPALTAPVLPSGPLADLHLPALSLSANLSLGGSRGLGNLLSLNLKSDLPGLPPVNETVNVGVQVPQLPQLPQLPQIPFLPIQNTLPILPTTTASLPALPQAPVVPAQVVDPTLLAVSRQTTNVPDVDDAAESGASAGANLLASRASNLAWANLLGGDAEIHEFNWFIGGGRGTGFTTNGSGEGALISEAGFNLRDGQLVEDFGLAERMDAPIVQGDDNAPAESTSDSALTLWLLGVLATCAGGSAYLSWRRQQDDLSLDVDPRLMPVG